MAITKKPMIEADSTNFGNLDVGVPGNYPINVADNGCPINDIGKHLQQLEQSMTDLMLKSDENKKMKMVCGSCYYPKNNPAKPLGEDAHFMCEEEQTIGVADGVGGWAKKGVDAGEFARELMSKAYLSVQNSGQERKVVGDTDVDIIGVIDPRKVLEEAYANTKENLALLGSSTACILSFDKDRGVLNAANVGDSGFMLCRDSRVVRMSEPMQHRFNCPYQLGNGGSINDGPESAQEYQLEGILPGDIIVIGTDGLLDNMYPKDIEDALQSIADWRANHNNITDRGYCVLLAAFIAKLALMNSMDEAFESPFSKEAEKAGLHLMGGKVDDITVIVAQVVV